MSINGFQRFILKHVIWLDWLLPAIMTLSGTFLNYDTTKLSSDKNALLAVIAEYLIPYLGWILGLSVLLYILVKVTEATAKPYCRKIEKELQDYEAQTNIISEQVRNLFDGYLYNLANRLYFGKFENNERISLYIHDSNNTFIPCGRFSQNPKYRNPSRTSYPDDEGCIAKGWEHGWFFDNNFPCPEAEQSNYRDRCLHEFNIPRNTTRAVNMKSRLYAVLTIKNNGDLFGVLVVESTQGDRFSEEQIKPILLDQNDFLAETIRQLKDFIPKPSNAATRGL